MILAPATMAAEKDPKEAARKCLEEIGLDPDGYRVGHTKARVEPLCRNFTTLVYCLSCKSFCNSPLLPGYIETLRLYKSLHSNLIIACYLNPPLVTRS